MSRFYIKQIVPRGSKFHIVDSESGLEIYDDEPYGRDQPLKLTEDEAYEIAQRLNFESESERLESDGDD